MIRRLYDWTMRLAEGPRALWSLGAISFAESSFFPIPPDVVVVPMVLARPKQAWLIATICTVASVLGGLVGYAIGYFAMESIGHWLIELYGMQDKAAEFHANYAEWGLWVILIKGLTPIPYKLVTIVSGAAQYALAPFIIASIITRGARFFLIAALLRAYGEPIRAFIERRLTLVTTLFVAMVVGGFMVLKYV
ncbi:YqaA family protein [Pedomonas mirosovicensis]|uniref:YqaA family protein n=1 Tax=Pedomonas mirosovicensis TaxID=2908641 RepID=UPI00216933A2|nr:YqaA family protein [Pedomonas mirosovicensis]MCH8684553.1 DedA family protein [Pedomonas mirosovicensis]